MDVGNVNLGDEIWIKGDAIIIWGGESSNNHKSFTFRLLDPLAFTKTENLISYYWMLQRFIHMSRAESTRIKLLGKGRSEQKASFPCRQCSVAYSIHTK